MNSAEFKRRFVPYYQVLYRVAFQLTGNAPDAEDLLHDAYLKLWKKRDRLGDAALNERYLAAVVKNCHIDRLRAGRQEVPLDLQDPPECPADDGLPDSGQLRELMRLVDKLPAREQQLLKAHFLEEIPYDQLSRQTGLTEVNLRQILFRARNKLKRQWKKIHRTR